MAAAGALFAALFWPALESLGRAWMSDPDSSHCLLVPLMSAYLIWSRRAELAAVPVKSAGAGLAILVGSLLLYTVSHWGGIELGRRAAIVSALNGAALYNFGWGVYRRILFPMLFLFLMIPVPVSVMSLASFPLQLFATEWSARLLGFLNVPVAHAGNLLRFPQGTLEVVEACSGIRSLLSFLTLALFFAYKSEGRWPAKAILTVSAVPIALAANVLRITISGVAAYVYGVKVAQGFLHDFSGFALFILGLAVFFLEARALENLFGRKAGAS
jgi:exosortase